MSKPLLTDEELRTLEAASANVTACHFPARG